MNEPQLFVICNHCGSEVSPYVTECPYCGKRLRKRAPDLGPGKDALRSERPRRGRRRKLKPVGPAKPRRAPRARLSFEGSRPRATIALIVTSAVLLVASYASGFPTSDLGLFGGIHGHPWIFVTAPLIHSGFGYAFIALVGVAIFGAALEERHGWYTVLAIWLVAGAAGVGAELALAGLPIAAGANAVAVALMFCWVIGQRRRGEQFDQLGVLAIGAALLALPLVARDASIAASLAGAIVGGAAGAILARPSRLTGL